jgi:4-diphosphocytidyl-2-C-methyl-D-erythritol kinase
VALPEYPQLLKLKEAFASQNVLGTMMSGSGPTMFALTESQSQAEEVEAAVKEKMADPDLEFWITQLNSNGISIAH